MSGWSGWILEFLVAANLPQTDENVTFLTDWVNHETATCHNNPVDLSRPVGNSTNCQKLTASRTAQNYTSHAQAASAFDLELTSGNFPNLLNALKGGTPLDKGPMQGVIDDLKQWGATKFAKYLTGIYFPPPPPPPKITGFHKGWADLQRSLGKHRLGPKVRDTIRMDTAALRQLERARKVRIR